jgi:hypothetical protein
LSRGQWSLSLHAKSPANGAKTDLLVGKDLPAASDHHGVTMHRGARLLSVVMKHQVVRSPPKEKIAPRGQLAARVGRNREVGLGVRRAATAIVHHANNATIPADLRARTLRVATARSRHGASDPIRPGPIAKNRCVTMNCKTKSHCPRRHLNRKSKPSPRRV